MHASKRPAPFPAEPSPPTQHVIRWDPLAPDVRADQYRAYDRMRRRCAVAYSEALQYSVFRHADVLRVLLDTETFSSQVSPRVAVPNGMDPPKHGGYRRIVDGYFTAEAMTRFAATCRALCDELVAALPEEGEFEVMAALAYPFALRAQCAFLGWGPEMYGPLEQWIQKKNAAAASADPRLHAAIALEFDQTIRRQLERCRTMHIDPRQDITARLLTETVAGQRLQDDEIVNILRNWTVGELATLAASVGIIVQHLAMRPDVQAQLREDPRLMDAANDEMLRIRAPLIANRRVVAKPTQLGGVELQPGDRLTLIWASANRDEAVFGDPDEFRLDRDPALNLLYGAGIHACPGAPLARLELRCLVEALLARGALKGTGAAPLMAAYPVGGYRRVMARLDTRSGAPI